MEHLEALHALIGGTLEYNMVGGLRIDLEGDAFLQVTSYCFDAPYEIGHYLDADAFDRAEPTGDIRMYTHITDAAAYISRLR